MSVKTSMADDVHLLRPVNETDANIPFANYNIIPRISVFGKLSTFRRAPGLTPE